MLKWSTIPLLTVALACAGAQATKPLVFDLASVHESKRGTPTDNEGPDSNVPLGSGNVYAPTHD